MKSFFDWVTRLSLRFRAITLALVVLVMVLGTVAGAQLKQELLPPIEFPQTFILAQASGMTSEQVLNVVTKRLDAEIDQVPEIVNLESTSTSAFGAIIIAANDFGLNQAKLRDAVQQAIDKVWFPSRRIAAPEGADIATWAKERVAELTPEVVLYFAQQDSNFAFEVSPEVWSALSDDALKALVAYEANQVVTNSGNKSALERLVEQEVVPQLKSIDQVANVQITGGQALPGEEKAFQAAGVTETDADAQSELLNLSEDAWDIISARLGNVGALDNTAVETLKTFTYTLPEGVPALPAGWLADHFSTADDVLEMSTLTRSVADVLDGFLTSGVIKGALGQTDDLTASDIEQMLAIDPTLVEYFKSEHLVAMSPEAFAALPKDYIDNLDGFTRDAIAAAVMAKNLTGVTTQVKPVDLPAAWRIQPPQIVTFSLASIPLATFSIFNTSEGETAVLPDVVAATESTTTTEQPEATETPETVTLTEGPKLPQLFTLIGGFFGATLDTADDLVQVQITGDLAEQFGITSIDAAGFFNQLAQFSNLGATGGGTDAAPAGFGDVNIASFVPALQECGYGLLDLDLQNLNLAKIIVGCVNVETFEYLVLNSPDFVANLQPAVFDYLSDDILKLDGVVPPLSDTWQTIATQPEFAQTPLKTAADIVALGDGKPSAFLNKLNDSVPDAFAGYEVRVLDSLSLGTVRYFQLKEADFFTQLSSATLLKLSPAILGSISADVLAELDAETADQVAKIVSGEVPSAATTLAERYVSNIDIPPTDPSAPALSAQWNIISQFVGLDQLANASDLLRLPEQFGTPGQFVNQLFVQNGSFASGLLSGLSYEAIAYVQERDPQFIDELSIQALNNLSADVLAQLPQAIQDKAKSGEVFIPTKQVTRTNGSPALLVTISKEQSANTVEAFYAVKAVVDKIDADNGNIAVAVAFEQSSFVEESISGVVREGSLGAFFAIIIILLFLSGGTWGGRNKAVTGIVIAVLSVILLVGVVGLQLGAAEGDFGKAWNSADLVVRFLSIGGIVVGLAIAVYPGNLPYPAWRSTLVIAVSIPLSVFAALALMRWLPPVLNGVFAPLAETSGIFQFLLRLAPSSLTLNIMTLSGLTVAVGRVVDDSIVVLENIFRQMQSGEMDKREAIITGTRDVSVAIFSATAITVVVFLPLGLTGGLVGEFFLPFGLAVTYALLSSFVVAITIVPLLAFWFVSKEDAHEEQASAMEHTYDGILRWSLKNNTTRITVVIVAAISMVIGFALFGGRPKTFLPEFGEPEISVAISMPTGTTMIETDKVARALEEVVRQVVPEEELKTVRTQIGGGGLDLSALVGGGGGVSENLAEISTNVETSDKSLLDKYTREIREKSVALYGEDIVSVSKQSLTSQGFGSFELVFTGKDQSILAQYDQCVLKVLNSLDGLANVTSNISQAGIATSPCPTLTFEAQGSALTDELKTSLDKAIRDAVAPAKVIVNISSINGLIIEVASLNGEQLAADQTKIEDAIKSVSGVSSVALAEVPVEAQAESTGSSSVFIRINQLPAVNYQGEVETEDTLALVPNAVKLINASMDLPEGYVIGQGFDSQFQSEGFNGIFVAIGIAMILVILILILVFGSPVYWFAVIGSVVVAPVGAAVALAASDRVLGISALIGLLMLLGLVVTNAVVLIDRVGANRHERKMNVYDSLIEAGERRLRPILMTALGTIFALLPLALGLSKGALIADGLGTVVIGGLVSSTFLTLLVVPVGYFMITPLHNFFVRRDRETGMTPPATPTEDKK